MIFKPLQPLKSLWWRFGQPNHESLSLEGTNTFTNFYLKDLTWSDNDNNMYLGLVVAAQHVLDVSHQNNHPRGKKWRVAQPLQASLSDCNNPGTSGTEDTS